MTSTLLPSLRTVDLEDGRTVSISFGELLCEEMAFIDLPDDVDLPYCTSVSVSRYLLHAFASHWERVEPFGEKGLLLTDDVGADVVALGVCESNGAPAVMICTGDEDQFSIIAVVARETIRQAAEEGWTTPFTCEDHLVVSRRLFAVVPEFCGGLVRPGLLL